MPMRPYGGGRGKACGHNSCTCPYCRPARRTARRVARLNSAKKTARRDGRVEALEATCEESDMEKEQLKVIFLDIDGVLNWAGTEDRINGFVGLDPSRIERFNKLIDAHPDAKIVISSTWRMSGLFGAYEDFEGLVKLLAARGLKGEVIDHTPIKMSHVGRGNEIRWWIEDWTEENPGKELAFVILDDDTEGMRGHAYEAFDFDASRETGEDVYKTITVSDLTWNHVVTTWAGELKTKDGLDEEGGLQDRHITYASRILSGWKD